MLSLLNEHSEGSLHSKVFVSFTAEILKINLMPRYKLDIYLDKDAELIKNGELKSKLAFFRKTGLELNLDLDSIEKGLALK